MRVFFISFLFVVWCGPPLLCVVVGVVLSVYIHHILLSGVLHCHSNAIYSGGEFIPPLALPKKRLTQVIISCCLI
jgi:hypothetical protein